MCWMGSMDESYQVVKKTFSFPNENVQKFHFSVNVDKKCYFKMANKIE